MFAPIFGTCPACPWMSLVQARRIKRTPRDGQRGGRHAMSQIGKPPGRKPPGLRPPCLRTRLLAIFQKSAPSKEPAFSQEPTIAQELATIQRPTIIEKLTFSKEPAIIKDSALSKEPASSRSRHYLRSRHLVIQKPAFKEPEPVYLKSALLCPEPVYCHTKGEAGGFNISPSRHASMIHWQAT